MKTGVSTLTGVWSEACPGGPSPVPRAAQGRAASGLPAGLLHTTHPSFRGSAKRGLLIRLSLEAVLGAQGLLDRQHPFLLLSTTLPHLTELKDSLILISNQTYQRGARSKARSGKCVRTCAQPRPGVRGQGLTGSKTYAWHLPLLPLPPLKDAKTELAQGQNTHEAENAKHPHPGPSALNY